MDKMDGRSLDILEENIGKVKQLFPEVFTEEKIDFEKLQQILGEYIEDEAERYDFTWNGKKDAIRISQTPTTGTLRPDKENSKSWDETENVYIEGDNLEVLKLLQKSYHNKIKMIYIDPPYNTGNDFVYKDNYRDNMKNYLKFTGQVDDEGKKISTNSESSGRYHTDWLNMMYPRLKLARNLLVEDGAIFISIDENEVHNLRKICDEIFGEDNFLTQMIVKLRHENRILKGDKDFHEVSEYCLIYKKGKKYKQTKIIKDNTSIDKYVYEIKLKSHPCEIVELDGKQVEVYSEDLYEVIKHENCSPDYLQWISVRGSLKEGNSSGRFYMKHLDGINKKYGYLYKVPNMGNDKFGYRFFMRQPTENHLNGVYFQGVPVNKSDIKLVPYPNFLDYVDIFNTVGYEGDVPFRNGKKPVKYIEHIMTLAGVEDIKDAIILDFFSGSATTAHAVMNLNAKDRGKRKNIMVQLPEDTDENSEAYKEGYKTVSEIGRERIRRAGEKIKEDNKDKEGIEDLDIGFKAFKLDSSNIKEWNPEYEDKEFDFESLVNNFVEGRNKDDILYEIILKYGINLTTPMEEHSIDEKTIYDIGFGTLYICLDNDIDGKVIEKIVSLNKDSRMERSRVVFKDTGFKNDEIKLNAKLTLENNGIEEVLSI